MNRRDWRDQNETRGYGRDERDRNDRHSGGYDVQRNYDRGDQGRYRTGGDSDQYGRSQGRGREGDWNQDERYGDRQGYGPYRRDDANDRWSGRDRGGFDPYRESYYGLPGGFYGGIPGGYAGMGWYDRGSYSDRDFYGDDRTYRGGRRGYDEDRGFFARAADEVSSWFGDEEAERRREQDHRGRGPKNYQRSDRRVEEDVNDRLTDDDTLDASEITVQVKDREVTLDGTVTSRYAKRRAEDCADNVSGVTHVQNNLRVQGMDDMSSASTQTTTGRQT